MVSPDISVIVPTHDRRDLLADLLASLTTQTLAADSWELIVVDDDSTDGTGEMLKEQARNWPTPFTILSGKHANPGAVRNAGAAAAKGGVLLFLDDDMTVVPELIEAHARAHVEPGMAVMGRILGPSTRHDPWTAWDDAQLARLADFLSTSSGQMPGPREFYAGNCSVEAGLFRVIGGYNTLIERGEDFDLAYRLAAAGARFSYCGKARSVHRGTHSFDRWIRNAAAFGRSEVTLAHEFGHESDFAAWYRDRHPLNRMLIRLCSNYPLLRKPLIGGINLIGRASYALGAKRVAISAYSAIYNLSYWRGLIDAFGVERFWSDARPYPPAKSLPSPQ